MTINLHGRLLNLTCPITMGIINATPDSFFAGSRTGAEDGDNEEMARRALELAQRHLSQGATILDVGACSTRPASHPTTPDEERRRLDCVLPVLRQHFPDAIISLDTFRADIADHCAERYAIDIINDVSAATIDPGIADVAARRRLPYVLTHGYCPTTQAEDAYQLQPDDEMPHITLARFFACHIEHLHNRGVADIILAPGFGFGKTRQQNFCILQHLNELTNTFSHYPWLIALSRKRMVYETLHTTPDEALNGTSVLNTIALQAGAHILRVHDVQPAQEAIQLLNALNFPTPSIPPVTTPSLP